MMLIGKHTEASFCLFSLLERGAKSYVDEMRSFLAIHFSTRSPFFLFLYSEYNRIIVQYIKINVIRPNEFFYFPPPAEILILDCELLLLWRVPI